MMPVAAVLTDIEGTTTPIAYVRDRLFPFARARLADFLAAHGDDPVVQAELAATRRLAPEAPALDTLIRWIDADAKATPLKTLQGLIWAEGYASGGLQAQLYDDVAPALRAWHKAGLALFAYSSGSVAAQRQIFGSSTAGDLTPLFSGFFDTRIGGKREQDSYDRIAISIGIPVPEILFLSDVEAELDAAAAAGLRTCQLVRADDGTIASPAHANAGTFGDVARLFGLSLPD